MTIEQNLNLVDGLRTRVSYPRLTAPAPTAEQLALAYQAAFRAPDHAWLRPWRFIECREQERELLGERLEQALVAEDPELAEELRQKVRQSPLRAPLVIICYADVQEHPKVPELEQHLATGCAANNLLNALYGLGYGAVWRTGAVAHSAAVHRALGLTSQQRIIGFLYVGTPATTAKALPVLDQQPYVTSLSQQLSVE